MRISISNKTDWQTGHLRAFVRRTIAFALPNEQFPAHLKISVVHTRWHTTSGWAYYPTASRAGVVRLRVSKNETPHLKRHLALLIAHELAHSCGYRHAQINGSPLYNWKGDWLDRYAWADDLPLEKTPPKPPKQKPTPEAKLQKKAAYVDRKVRELATKMKRTQTILKKWQKKQKYYAKKIAST
jgi:hypothetical protein